MILLRPDGELKRPDRQKDTWQASLCCTQRQIRERKRICVEGQIAHNCTQRKRERERERERKGMNGLQKDTQQASVVLYT